MPQVRMTLDIPDDVLALLNKRAESLMAAESPPNQFEWLNGSPEGKELIIDMTCRGKFNHMSNQDVNALIKKKYREAIGDSGLGRPPIGIYRARAAVEYIISGLGKGEVVAIPPKVPVKQWSLTIEAATQRAARMGS